ncbi:hypothetical protein BZG74_14495 [Salinivibrio sharmensis]|uniref:Uncharacterized protein n=1 Tax=Salinivibrio sharmensis TaxID=390883 RepID=A0ABX3K903_9GAMM|nr:hypothetical protein BZG74_14495 [Salinivibrio sharmensis]
MCTLPTGRLSRSVPILTTMSMAPCNGRAAEITPSLCDREGAYTDLRLVYISMIPSDLVFF